LKNKAVFLDRDGVLNHDPGDYTYLEEEFTILPDVAEVLKSFAAKGFKLIVITNQGGIGRGRYNLNDYYKINELLFNRLKSQGVELTDHFFCPHHPVSSNCLCRKPGSLLVEKAVHLHNVDTEKSFFIGDKQRDLDAGNALGIKGIKIEVNTSLKLVQHLIN
jgi:D-glycero-D-manno-heptose 1,7-bisphosphate phosphatase